MERHLRGVDIIAEVIPIRGRHDVEQIGLRAIDLSQLSAEELRLLSKQCEARAGSG